MLKKNSIKSTVPELERKSNEDWICVTLAWFTGITPKGKFTSMFKQIGIHFFLEDKASVLAQQSEIFSVDQEMRDKILQKFMNLYRKSFSQEMLF